MVAKKPTGKCPFWSEILHPRSQSDVTFESFCSFCKFWMKSFCFHFLRLFAIFHFGDLLCETYCVRSPSMRLVEGYLSFFFTTFRWKVLTVLVTLFCESGRLKDPSGDQFQICDHWKVFVFFVSKLLISHRRHRRDMKPIWFNRPLNDQSKSTWLLPCLSVFSCNKLMHK